MAHDVRLIRSPVSVTGMVLTTISAVLFLVVFLADLFGLHSNPYIGLVFFVVLPGVFVLGLLLIPLGAWLERQRRRAGKAPSEVAWPQIDLNDPRPTADCGRDLHLDAGQRGDRFAGRLSRRRVHGLGAVLRPGLPQCDEARSAPRIRTARTRASPAWPATSAPARRRSPKPSSRARVSSSPWRARLIARPIAAPVRTCVPARDTCEQCHWPEQVARRQGPTRRRVRRRREEHRVGDHAAAACRRRQRTPGHRQRHPLAHERREPRSSTSRPTTSARSSPGSA